MSTRAAQYHHNAAEHLTQAAFHHRLAQKHQEEGRYKEAAHHALLAQAHQHYAHTYTTEAAKAHLDAHGRAEVVGAY